MMFEEQREKWKELEPRKRYFLVSLVILLVVLFIFDFQYNKSTQEKADALKVRKDNVQAQRERGESIFTNVIPPTARNQGLEDLHAELKVLKEDLEKLSKSQSIPQRVVAPEVSNRTLVENKPPAIEFNLNDDLPKSIKGGVEKPQSPVQEPETNRAVPVLPKMKTWVSETVQLTSQVEKPKGAIPIYSALEGVMLTGIYARPPGDAVGSVGAASSASAVGAPFVSRVKGNAILPNGWKSGDLGDCFVGGSAVAMLSAMRAYATSENISCVAPNGEVWESPMKAYGVDVDGNLGLAGHPVNKQGEVLGQAFLTGIVSGLGTALAPTPIPGYNSGALTGAQAYQSPDPGFVARSAMGQGTSNAASQLSRFYLEFARQLFPVIEVNSGTRITWVLKEALEFKKVSTGATK